MACIDPGDSLVGEGVSETVQATKTGCPSWGCGGNSPLIGPYRFNELDENGAPNDANMRLVGFLKNGVMYRVDVVADKLYARAGRVVLSGTTLVGGKFEIDTVPGTDYPGGRVEIEITHVSNNVTFWQGPATPVETYELQYTGPNVPPGTRFAVCKDPPDSLRDGEGTSYPDRFESILYTGDRYDATHKLVTASSYAEAGGWFNIACAGSALAKLHLNRHTTASTIDGYSTTAVERQTMLKMYTGDFCGTGEPFTQQGTALHWSSNKGWASPWQYSKTYESLWNEHGAVCLLTHRLHGLSPIDYQGDIQGTTNPVTAGECPKLNCYAIFGFPNLYLTGTYMLTQSNGVP
ncbi:MAG TPA: ADYC domain-containing protein [Kofleriaceae bacterium]|nr:ADYC domain-containing protein [Kofleriaceae bacterium]